ncbi:MAG: hypothetical protein R3C53_21130 [Pirellulaceae bacterium]
MIGWSTSNASLARLTVAYSLRSGKPYIQAGKKPQLSKGKTGLVLFASGRNNSCLEGQVPRVMLLTAARAAFVLTKGIFFPSPKPKIPSHLLQEKS